MTNTIKYNATDRILPGNYPYILDIPDTVWLVSSGTMAVFAVATEYGEAKGTRRYLFDVNPGDILIGIPVNKEGYSYTLTAIGYEETHLQEITINNWLKKFRHNDSSTAEISNHIKNWSKNLVIIFANSEIDLAEINTEEISTAETIIDAIEQFHADFLRCLHELEEQEKTNRSQQFNARLKLNRDASERALDQLTSIFRPRESEFTQEGGELLIAAGAVGKALGIEIRPPARSEDPKRVKDGLEAIARASRIRTRRVILSGKWWNSDCGALLAYTKEGDRPVALLPINSNKYEVFSPHDRQRIPVDINIAQQISPVAYMLYRPFPERALKTLDIVKFALRGRERDIAVVLILGVVASLSGMLTPLATGILIDKAIPDANRNLILQIAIGLLAIIFGSTIFDWINNIAAARIETFAGIQTQAAVWDRLLKLRVSFFRKYSTGDLQSRVSAIQQIQQTLSTNVLITMFSSFFSLLNLGFLFVYNAQLAIVAIVVAIVSISVTIFSAQFSRKTMLPLQEMQGDIFGLTVQLISGVSKLHVAAAEERAYAYWSNRFSQILKLQLSTQTVENTATLFNTVLPTLSSMAIYTLAVGMLAQSQISGGERLSTGAFLTFNTAFGTFISGTTGLSNVLISMQTVGVLWERAQPILTELPEVDLDKTDPGRLQGGVRLDRVSFRYREDGPLTLDKVSIEAKPGEFIAFVGPSGSGKSTTLRLLLGFEQPEDGTIYYDGQDLSGLDISAVRRQLGVVLQNGRINSASIFENISSGALVTMDEAWEAARMAGFDKDIEQMPMGMHTVISEGGTNLSGGQRQRLLIARSLVLKPRILIFDEATSALDNRTQAIVSESLEQLKVTRIVIAHRLSTIRNADRIYVIAAGQVMQVGSYDELMAQPGMFADLMARQVA